jgi:hypothetical protein
MAKGHRAGGFGRRPLLAAFAAAPLAAPAAGRAQGAWPSRTIRVIVPFAPGGATDLITRLVTDRLGGALGQQVVVENRGGAFGVVGADAAAKAPADGYTLLAGSPGPLAVNQHVFKSLPYDPEKDFVPVSMVASIPYVMVVPTSVPARSVQEFIALVRANPGKYNFGTSGMASRLTVEMFRAMAGGLDLTMLQYRGGAHRSAARRPAPRYRTDPWIHRGFRQPAAGAARGRHAQSQRPAAGSPHHARIRSAGLRGLGLGRIRRAHRHAAPRHHPRGLGDRPHPPAAGGA